MSFQGFQAGSVASRATVVGFISMIPSFAAGGGQRVVLTFHRLAVRC